MNRRHAYVPPTYSGAITGALRQAGLASDEELSLMKDYLQHGEAW